MRRLKGFIKLIRPINCLMMGFAVIVGASLLGTGWEKPDLPLRLLLGFVTAYTLTGASMAINDYYDREIDAINEPDHPIPSGLVSPKESLIIAALLTVIGLSTAALTNPPCLAVATLAWIIMITYNTRGKRTGLPGNLLVSACVSIPFIYGGLLVGGRVEVISLLFAGLAFLSNTGREVNKGIVDIPGDRSKDIRTVAVSHGGRVAAYVASIFYLTAVALSLLPPILNFVSPWYLPIVAITDAGFILSSILLIRRPTRENAKRIKNLALLWMAVGMVAFITGALTR
ncbi:hypothetical protein DRO55_00035 [Candidatus Bathyarchaeota archaeon]|nr:MAG: hypothetical protein DRO55_00035 [Candidatus Bathyarchaeota archaeon]